MTSVMSALVRPSRTRQRRQNQMPGRGNRQEFGDALDEGKDDDLFDRHW